METLIYLALYAILMAGAVVSAYAIFSSTARNQTKAMVQQEGSFLVGKLDWALTGARTIHQPNDANPSTIDEGDTLSIATYDTTIDNPVVLTLTGGDLTIARGGNPAEVLNNDNLHIHCPPAGCFQHISASGDGINPESLKAAFTVTTRTSEGILYSQDFSTVKYLRK